jgi:hypothetical protein
MSHRLYEFSFQSLATGDWGAFPEPRALEREIASALLAHSEVSDQPLGLYAPPKEIREIRVVAAVFDQISCMWHGHRARGQWSPPPVPLKVFVFGFGQDATSTWASVEVLPGIDNWEVE